MRGDNRVKAVAIDGYTALNAYVPPKERRGLVLIDPPFEQPDEFARLAQALAGAHRKWPTGIYAALVPDQGRARDRKPSRAASPGLSIPRILRAELTLPGAGDERLRGSGLIARQPALDAGRRARASCFRRWRDVLRRRAGRGATRLDWLDGRKVRRCGGAPLSSAARLMSTLTCWL